MAMPTVIVRMTLIATGMTEIASSLRLQRLFQLASPSLPVGAFAYSEGLETAVAHDRIVDAAGVGQWLSGVLDHSLGGLDLPILYRLHGAWRDCPARAPGWSRYLIASRETAERRAQERHLGNALASLLCGLGFETARAWRMNGAHGRIATFATLFALAAATWGIDAEDTAAAFVWAWLENQVLAAVKLVPLGQTEGQRLLIELTERVPPVLAQARAVPDDLIGGALPGATLMCTGHEVLYSRLFRS